MPGGASDIQHAVTCGSLKESLVVIYKKSILLNIFLNTIELILIIAIILNVVSKIKLIGPQLDEFIHEGRKGRL